MERIIETERLYLRKLMLKDASSIFKMNNNPNTPTHEGYISFKNIKETEIFIELHINNKVSNITKWAVCGKRQGEFLGLCTLQYNQAEDQTIIEHQFSEKYWNKGFATEVTKGVITYAFNALRIQDVYTYINRENKSAIKVALKAGLTFLKETIQNENLTNLYHKKNNLVSVRKISTEDTLMIRQSVLRQGKPIESCFFDGDNRKNSLHLGLYYYGDLIGIATFMENNHPDFDELTQYQLRGMAILHQFQGKRLGNVLLEEGIKKLKKRKVNLLWCNAREIATNFYLKFDFKIYGKSFEIKGIGKHFTMFKSLK
jgi:RimJ/RimL family protein N-acetyltransferase/predicted GNAT family N-acyltransferase